MGKKAKDNVNSITFDRAQLAEVLGKIVRSTKPKDKDPSLRRAVYFNMRDGMADLYSTNEIISLLFCDIPCEIQGEPMESFALDLVKISKYASAASGEKITINYDEENEKVKIKSKSEVQIGYWSGDDYTALIGRDNPIEYPDDIEEYRQIDNVKDFRSIMRIMVGCADIKKPHLSGIYTDGKGTFMATDMFKGMQVHLDYDWGFQALIPIDFFGLLDSIDGSVHLYWYNDVLWARDSTGSVVVSSFTRSADKFPSANLSRFFDDVAETGEYLAVINAPDLDNSIRQLRSFFGGDDLKCTLDFRKKIIISATNNSKDIMRDVVKYRDVEDSKPLADMNFDVMLNVLSIIPTVFDGDFTLQMISNNKPMYTKSADLGIKLMIVPFWTGG